MTASCCGLNTSLIIPLAYVGMYHGSFPVNVITELVMENIRKNVKKDNRVAPMLPFSKELKRKVKPKTLQIYNIA